jgi:hypothetical protein
MIRDIGRVYGMAGGGGEHEAGVDPGRYSWWSACIPNLRYSSPT